MTTTTESSEILKTDRLGRIKTPAVRREALLVEFDRSGMSAAQFARYVGVNYQTFAAWRQKRRKEREGERVVEAETSRVVDESIRWVEAVVERKAGEGSQCPPKSGSTAASVQIVLPGGAKFEVQGAEQVEVAAEIIAALQRKGVIAC